MPEAIIVVDLRGRITFWNAGAERLYGWSAREALGQDIVALVPTSQSRQQAEEIMARLQKGETWEGVFEARTKDGRTLQVHVHDAPLLDDEGRLAGIIGASRDVTEQQAAAAALRASHTRFELAARATREVMWEFDLQTSKSWRNDGFIQLFGQSEHELAGPLWLARIHPDDRTRVADSLERAIEGDAESWSEAYQVQRADGTYAHVLDRAYIERDAAGKALRLVGALVDVTQTREQERALLAARSSLAQAEKLSAMGLLVSGVAHELRTPLAYMATNLHVLQTRLELAAASGLSAEAALGRVQPHIAEALEGVDRINRLVLELRRFHQTPAGVRLAASLHAPVGEAVALFAATSRGRVTLETSLAPTSHVRMDPSQVQQVVLNLLENAADAAPGGIIHVSTRSTRAGAELTVRDGGAGIPAEVRERIFEAFFSTKTQGTGLGLAIVARIVREHDGDVQVESRPGAGTTFTVTFPAHAGGADDDDADDDDDDDAPGSRNR